MINAGGFIEIEIFGAKTGGDRLIAMGERAVKAKPALWTIREDMFRVIRATFEGQGRRYGGSWTFLSEAWETRKINAGLDPRILIARGTLMRSLTERGHSRMRSRVTNELVTLRTTLPYAETHQYGDEDRNIPARPFIDFYPQDRERWRAILMDYVMGAVRGV